MIPDEYVVGKAKIRLVKDDLTEMATDAIVNAANSTLFGGGGVDGAIHRKGGPKILEECRLIRQTVYPDGLPTGQAVITSGGNLKAKFVIHTVGPVWHGGSRGEPELLSHAYRNSLGLAGKNGLKTVAFPSISTGAYGYPIELASSIALWNTKEFLETLDRLALVVFVLFSDFDLAAYKKASSEVFW
jgi:O-acetyl-ADP-ribose deacetylase (regulator of RNase III)